MGLAYSQLISRNLALYVIPVRRARDLLTVSFRFHLTMDTLAVRAIHFPLSGCVRDLHPLELAHGAQTTKKSREVIPTYFTDYFK